MKWFKHLSGSLNDSFIFELIETFGGDGYLVFFGCLELIADEFDVEKPGFCRFSVKKLTKNLQISRRKLTKVLNFTTEKGRLLAQHERNHICLNCPRLKDLTDEYTQRLLSKNVGTVSGQTPVQEVEVEEEEEQSNKDLSIQRRKETIQRNKMFEIFWEKYPIKKGKKPAQVSFKKIPLNNGAFDAVIAGLERALVSEDWTKDSGKFIPHPTTWLNQERWNDEYKPKKERSFYSDLSGIRTDR